MSEFQEESPPAVPGWVMSFGDMVTNLMACFVLLLSMASTQSSTLFYVGQGSFRRAIAGFGIPNLLFGKEVGPGMDYRKLKYPTDEADDEEIEMQRVMDADDANIRTTFADLKRQMDVEATNLHYKPVHYEVVVDAFEPGKDTLRAEARSSLEMLAYNTAQNFSREDVALYLVARAEGPAADRDTWRLSAQRAQSAADGLRKALDGQGWAGCKLNAWGDGDGSQVVERFATQASIVVVVMKLGDGNG